MTIEECIAAFGQEVTQQDASIWTLLVLGAIAVCVGLFLAVRNQVPFQNALILILVGGAFIVVSRTGSIPGLSGSLAAPSFENTSFQKTIRAGCNEQYYARASDVPAGVPVETIKASPDTSSAIERLSALDGTSSFVWVFYANDRLQDAEEIGRILTESGIASNVAADDFSQVLNKQSQGTTRIIYSDNPSARLATAIGEAAAEGNLGEIVIQGPFSSISRGPIQIQLY